MITKNNKTTIIERVVQAMNLGDTYCSKLRHSLKAGYQTKEIEFYHYLDLLIDSENCIY